MFDFLSRDLQLELLQRANVWAHAPFRVLYTHLYAWRIWQTLTLLTLSFFHCNQYESHQLSLINNVIVTAIKMMLLYCLSVLIIPAEVCCLGFRSSDHFKIYSFLFFVCIYMTVCNSLNLLKSIFQRVCVGVQQWLYFGNCMVMMMCP